VGRSRRSIAGLSLRGLGSISGQCMWGWGEVQLPGCMQFQPSWVRFRGMKARGGYVRSWQHVCHASLCHNRSTLYYTDRLLRSAVRRVVSVSAALRRAALPLAAPVHCAAFLKVRLWRGPVSATSVTAGRFSHLDDVSFSDEIKMSGITIRLVTFCKAEHAAHDVCVGVLRFVQTTYGDFISICCINWFC